MELIVIFILTVLNGVLAMSEAAVIAARKPRLEQRANEGDSNAAIALELAEEPNRFLSTVQIGITLIGVLAGAFGGATLANDIADIIAEVEPLAEYADALGFAVIVLITSYLSLIIGELVPKRLAIQQPETIASLVAPVMKFLSRITYPVVWFLGVSSDTVLRLLGQADVEETAVSEAEIRVMLREGLQAGVFDTHEQEMVEGVFRLDDLNAAALMTPRTETTWLDVDAPADAIREVMLAVEHHYYPLKQGSVDEIVGVVRARDVMRALMRDQTPNLRTLAFPPIFVPNTLTADIVLERLRGRTAKMAVVIGEHGGTLGIITMQDIIEAVMGDIDNPEAVENADGSWLIDGLMPVAEFKDLLHIRELPDELAFNTLAGFVLTQLADIPQAGERFQWNGFAFEVVEMDGNRVEKVRVMLTTKDSD